LILNELAHHAKEDFAQTLLDNAEKVPWGVVIVMTNAGHRPGWQWSLREMARESDRWYFSVYDEPAPWIDAAGLEERRRTTAPSRFLRLWRGQWIEGDDGDALDADLLRAAFCLDGPTLTPEAGWTYAGGCDAGLTRDHASLVVVGRHDGHTVRTPRPPKPMAPTFRAMIDAGLMEPLPVEEDVVEVPATGRLRVCSVATWRPPAGGQIDLSAVESACVESHRRFRLCSLAYDPWQMSHLAQRAARLGVPMLELSPTPQNLRDAAASVLEAVNARLLECYDDADLRRDLGRLRLVERSFGVRLQSPRVAGEGHGDSASALANALVALRRIRDVSRPIEGPLIVWPAA
jgi:hypothetical protein